MEGLLHYIGGFTPLILNYLNFNLDMLCNIPHLQATVHCLKYCQKIMMSYFLFEYH